MDVHFKTPTHGSAKIVQPESHGAKKTPPMGTRNDNRLKKACADFEGLFLNMMVQTMRKTIPEGGIFGKSHQSDMYDALFLQEVSTKLAKERGLGIGDALYRQVRRKIDMNGPG